MLMEVRHIATVRDLMAIELERSKSQCGYRVTINLDGVTCDDTVCPGCGEVWWSRDVPSNGAHPDPRCGRPSPRHLPRWPACRGAGARARPAPRSCGWSFPGVWMPTRVGENVLGRGAGKSVMPLRFMAFVLAAFVGWTVELGATLVVAYRSSDGIVVAADSLRTLVNSRTGQRGQVPACKVREFGDIVFAAAGVSHAAGPFLTRRNHCGSTPRGRTSLGPDQEV